MKTWSSSLLLLMISCVGFSASLDVSTPQILHYISCLDQARSQNTLNDFLLSSTEFQNSAEPTIEIPEGVMLLLSWPPSANKDDQSVVGHISLLMKGCYLSVWPSADPESRSAVSNNLACDLHNLKGSPSYLLLELSEDDFFKIKDEISLKGGVLEKGQEEFSLGKIKIQVDLDHGIYYRFDGSRWAMTSNQDPLECLKEQAKIAGTKIVNNAINRSAWFGLNRGDTRIFGLAISRMPRALFSEGLNQLANTNLAARSNHNRMIEYPLAGFNVSFEMDPPAEEGSHVYNCMTTVHKILENAQIIPLGHLTDPDHRKKTTLYFQIIAEINDKQLYKLVIEKSVDFENLLPYVNLQTDSVQRQPYSPQRGRALIAGLQVCFDDRAPAQPPQPPEHISYRYAQDLIKKIIPPVAEAFGSQTQFKPKNLIEGRVGLLLAKKGQFPNDFLRDLHLVLWMTQRRILHSSYDHQIKRPVGSHVLLRSAQTGLAVGFRPYYNIGFTVTATLPEPTDKVGLFRLHPIVGTNRFYLFTEDYTALTHENNKTHFLKPIAFSKNQEWELRPSESSSVLGPSYQLISGDHDHPYQLTIDGQTDFYLEAVISTHLYKKETDEYLMANFSKNIWNVKFIKRHENIKPTIFYLHPTIHQGTVYVTELRGSFLEVTPKGLNIRWRNQPHQQPLSLMRAQKTDQNPHAIMLDMDPDHSDSGSQHYFEGITAQRLF